MSTNLVMYHMHNQTIQGQDAGEFFPFRVMAQGTPDELTWFVVRPDGSQVEPGLPTAQDAGHLARTLYSVWSA